MTENTPTPVSSVTAGGRAYTTPFAAAVPPQTAEERQRLTADIRAHGIRVSVLVTEDDEVLDGHHRLAVAAELGLPADQVPIRVESGLTEVQKRHLAVTLNTHRRHLTAEQVRATIADLLAADPRQSDRVVAGRAGADHKTVGRVRAKMVAGGAVPRTDTVQGKDGRTRRRPAAKAPPAAAPAPAQSNPAPPAPATRPGVTWEELQKVVRPLRDLTTAVYRSWLANGNQRTPERVRKHVRVLTEISARLEAVAAAQEARTRPA